MRSISFETVGSVSAMVVGVASLFVAMNEAGSVRRQQAAAVLPIVKMTTFNSSSDEGTIVSLEVENVGIGPAFIEAERMSLDGTPIIPSEGQTAASALREVIADDVGDAGFWTSRLEGEIMRSGDSFPLFSATWRPETEGRGAYAGALIRRLFNDLDLEICYCSVFDECWETTVNAEERPKPIKSCEAFERH